ncbi:MAG: glycosyltransferase [Bacteroidetes bacterium]|nr:glycosyltransferase [Bacteroidota bacterium]
MKKAINIGIQTKHFAWAGGVDLLHTLVKGLLIQKVQPVSIYVLIHDSSIKKPLALKVKSALKKMIAVVEQPKTLFSSSGKGNKIPREKPKQHFDLNSYVVEIFSQEKVNIVYYNDDHPKANEKILSFANIDVLMPLLYNYLPLSNKIPIIGYIFDFVYKYHSHLYSSDFCLQTDIAFATTLLRSNAVIVNSKDVYQDIKKFFPYSDKKIYTLPFAPHADIRMYQLALAKNDILKQYGIEEKYFIISNQFWLHKSHETALEALVLLHQVYGFKDIGIVCTGSMTDLSGTSRRKEELEKLIIDLGIQSHVYFLGHLSKVDQLSLMIRSEGLLQPTTFEGGPGGGAVYMAVAYGIPSIVSDIDVNLEIKNEPLVTFFKVKDSNDLALKMKEQLKIGFELISPSDIESRNNTKLDLLGQTLIECINFVTQQ